MQKQTRDLYLILLVVGAIVAYQFWVKSDNNISLKSDTSQVVKTVTPSQIVDIIDSDLIKVTTDVVKVWINPVGGEIVRVDLLNFDKRKNSDDNVEVMYYNDSNNFIASSGISGVSGDKGDRLRTFSSSSKEYFIGDQANMVIELSHVGDDGMVFSKNFYFKPGQYAIGVESYVNNGSGQLWTGRAYDEIRSVQLLPEPIKPSEYWPGNISSEDKGSGMVGMKTYVGASFGSEKNRYKKLPYADIQSGSSYNNQAIDWVAIQQKYFLSAWIPDHQFRGDTYLYSRWIENAVGDDDVHAEFEEGFAVGEQSKLIRLQPNEEMTIRSTFYAGPEDTAVLQQIYDGLHLTVDYGWLWFISQKLFMLLEFIHTYIPNWGLSIIAITVFMKLVFYKLSANSYESMAKLKTLQPRLLEIQERFKDDPMQKNQAMVELYRREKINPLGGCLPMVVQIPIFMALYFVLIEAVQLRHADFLWIKDLSVYDPYFILPVLMGLSMYVQQKMSPAPSDPAQAKMMMVFPVVLTGLFAYLPSGLVLYWFVNNVLSVAQQYWVSRPKDD